MQCGNPYWRWDLSPVKQLRMKMMQYINGPTTSSEIKIMIHTLNVNGASKPVPVAEMTGLFMSIIHSPSSSVVTEYLMKSRVSDRIGMNATATSESCDMWVRYQKYELVEWYEKMDTISQDDRKKSYQKIYEVLAHCSMSLAVGWEHMAHLIAHFLFLFSYYYIRILAFAKWPWNRTPGIDEVHSHCWINCVLNFHWSHLVSRLCFDHV